MACPPNHTATPEELVPAWGPRAFDRARPGHEDGSKFVAIDIRDR